MGWMELMLVGVVALIVVGPKDLPVMFQSLGKMTAKVKRMAREFSTAMSDAADATGAKDIAKDLKGITNPKAMGLDKLKEAADSFDKWEPGKANKTISAADAKANAERAEQTRKIKAKMTEAGQAKLDKEAMAAEAAKVADKAKDLPLSSKPKATAAEATPAKTTKPRAKAKPAATKAKPAATPKAKPAAKPKTTTAAAKAKPKTTRAKKPKASDAS